jgi:SNF2 family DNA or RNA helicase
MRLCDWGDGQTLPFTFRLPKSEKEILTPVVDVEITRKGERLWFKMLEFSKALNNIIKTDFSKYKWHGCEEPKPIKQWSVAHCAHNWFQISYLAGFKPYAPYQKPLPPFEPSRPIYDHQRPMASHILNRHYSILAGEMGVGKTLALIEALEAAYKLYGVRDCLYVAPRSALASVELEFEKWECKIKPVFITYHGLEKHNREWQSGRPVYQFIVFDEASRLKSLVAKRTIAAQWLADAVREEWGDNGWVCAMSGSPAPKSPEDWYSLCEIVQPGFIKEGTIHAYKDRLAIIETIDNGIGASYPKLKTWRDDSKKCNICGNYADHEVHSQVLDEFNAALAGDTIDAKNYHAWVPSIDEVSKLHRRMAGLVQVVFKKDCLSLPAKVYHKIVLKPTKSMLRAANLICDTAPSTIKALTYLRQLSDGFRYSEVACGTETCVACNGTRTTREAVYVGPDKTWAFLASIGGIPDWIDPSETDALPEDIALNPSEHPTLFEFQDVACANCNGSGKVTKYERSIERVDCPKDDALRNLLEEYEEVGRLVVYGGFTGTVDRIVEICQEQQWHTIRVDGRGVESTLEGDFKSLLKQFQDRKNPERIVFVGQPGAAGMGLTLTAACGLVYFSNDFNGESRIQSEDRIHRAGMDSTRGANIYDLFHLPTDEYVYDNLKNKRRLQDLSLGEIKSHLELDDVSE